MAYEKHSTLSSMQWSLFIHRVTHISTLYVPMILVFKPFILYISHIFHCLYLIQCKCIEVKLGYVEEHFIVSSRTQHEIFSSATVDVQSCIHTNHNIGRHQHTCQCYNVATLLLESPYFFYPI